MLALRNPMFFTFLYFGFSSFSTRAFAQEDCSPQPEDQQLNATGAVSFPGFHPPDGEETTWTLKSAMRTTGREVNRTWWLETEQDLSRDTVDFNGVFLMLEAPDSGELSPSDNGPDSCKSVLSDDCSAALLQTAKDMAAQKAVKEDDDTEFGFWNIRTPSVCDEEVVFSAGAWFIGGNLWAENITDGTVDQPDCFDSNIGAGTPYGNNIISSNIAISGEETNVTYDRDVRQAHPVVLYAASNNRSSEVWSDARLVCLTLDQITPGSRDPATSSGTTFKAASRLSFLTFCIVLATCAF